MNDAAQYLVLYDPHWRDYPNQMALVRVYPATPGTIWFGIASDSDGRSQPYPANASVVYDYGTIADDDHEAQSDVEFSVIYVFLLPDVAPPSAHATPST